MIMMTMTVRVIMLIFVVINISVNGPRLVLYEALGGGTGARLPVTAQAPNADITSTVLVIIFITIIIITINITAISVVNITFPVAVVLLATSS